MLATISISIIALLHIGFMMLEMFFWTKPAGRRVFATSAAFAAQSKTLAMNQGLYNGFLAAGLIWGLLLGDEGFAVCVFFLGCVLIAGVFGALTASRAILYVQALPAAVALILLYTGY